MEEVHVEDIHQLVDADVDANVGTANDCVGLANENDVPFVQLLQLHVFEWDYSASTLLWLSRSK